MGTTEECNRISRLICDAAIEVHRELGPGLLESIYEEALACEFDRRRIFYERQKCLPISYKGESLSGTFRIDFMVERLVVVELKVARVMEPLFRAQLLTYLKLSDSWLGLLLNFNATRMHQGIQRVVHGRS